MSSVSKGGQRAANQGIAYGAETLESAGSAERVFNVGIETTTILIQSNPNNGGNIFIGFDDDVDSTNGIILQAGGDISLDVDLQQVPMFATAATGGDELRFMAIN